MKRYRSRWIVPITQPPIENGCLVEDGGSIVYVGTVGGAPDGDDHDFGDAVILPGLINAHTHLELTSMRGFLEDLCFNDWIDKLRSSRKEALTDDMLIDSARYGIVEGLESGVTTYADTCATGFVMLAMLEMSVRGIMFQETFGSGPEQCDASIEALRARVAELAPMQTDLVKLGISPHAPYTVSDALYKASADFAKEGGWPMGLHIAESEAEQELVCSGSGAFAEEWKERNLEVRIRGRSPVEVLEKTGCLDTSPLLIHAVRLDAQDIATIAAHNCTIAHCPASNAKFGHGIAPLAEYLEAGISVGLGSDSVASNNRMDILEEARLAVLFQRAVRRSETMIPAHTALELATIGGARALHIDDRVGSLEVGKDADLSVFSLSAARVTPVGNVDAAIVFALAGARADFVAVQGRPLVVDGVVLDVDPDLRGRVHAAGEALSAWEKSTLLT